MGSDAVLGKWFLTFERNLRSGSSWLLNACRCVYLKCRGTTCTVTRHIPDNLNRQKLLWEPEMAYNVWNYDDLAKKKFYGYSCTHVNKHVSLVTPILERCVEAHRCVLKDVLSWATGWWVWRITTLVRWRVPAEMWQKREVWATYPSITFRIWSVCHAFQRCKSLIRSSHPGRIPAVLKVTSLKLFERFREALRY